MYLERLSVQGVDSNDNPNKYYKPSGEFDIYPMNADVNLPNCTMYCYCRGFEAMESEKAFNWVRSGGGFGNAKTWFSTTTMPKGYELKEHSIAVFDGNCGHVAFVEEVLDSNHAIISESNYDRNKYLRNWKYWQKRAVELTIGKATLSGVGKLIGFIYLPVNDKRVVRNSNVNQVQITEDMVNVRQSPGGDRHLGLFCPKGIYNVISFKDEGNYKWAQFDTDAWVAVWDNVNNSNVSWATIYEVEQEESSSVKELKAQVKELKEENKVLTAKLKDVKDKLEDIIKSI